MFICGFLYGMTEEEWGRYHYCMVLPCLSTCIMLCVATVRRCVDV